METLSQNLPEHRSSLGASYNRSLCGSEHDSPNNLRILETGSASSCDQRVDAQFGRAQELVCPSLLEPYLDMLAEDCSQTTHSDSGDSSLAERSLVSNADFSGAGSTSYPRSAENNSASNSPHTLTLHQFEVETLHLTGLRRRFEYTGPSKEAQDALTTALTSKTTASKTAFPRSGKFVPYA